MRSFAVLPLFALATLACSSKETSPQGSGGTGGSPGSGGSAGDGGGSAPFTLTAFDDVRIGSDSSGPNFQRAQADVDWGAGPFASVRLRVQLRSTCYPFESWSQNPPPSGQSWPRDCDAFDRNFELSLDDPSDASGPPGLELVRAITPFGGPEELDVDITDVANGLPGAHALNVLISTWSDGAGQVSGSNGGWNVSARVEVTPGVAPRSVLAVESLFYANVGQTNPSAETQFTTPAGATSGRIEYRVTGHGGDSDLDCGIGAPADEFCQRTHTTFVDGTLLESFVPWRDDCQTLCTETQQPAIPGIINAFTYCAENPCGNRDSVRAPRANWCPGSETPPKVFSQPALAAPGDHVFRWEIGKIAAGGTWRVSATYFAFGH